jgi:hypothetical protein
MPNQIRNDDKETSAHHEDSNESITEDAGLAPLQQNGTECTSGNPSEPRKGDTNDPEAISREGGNADETFFNMDQNSGRNHDGIAITICHYKGPQSQPNGSEDHTEVEIINRDSLMKRLVGSSAPEMFK